MSQIWERAPYSGGELLVLLALADWSDDAGWCWPSVSKIAAKSRLSERQVGRILARLCAAGVLSSERGGGRGRPSGYQMHPGKMAAPARKVPPVSGVNPDKMSGFLDGGNPDICDTETLTSATQNPDICGARINRTVNRTVSKEKEPSPTPSAGAEGGRGDPQPRAGATEPGAPAAGIESDVERVMLGCGLADRRVRLAVTRAMEMHLARGELDARACADLMIGNHREYVRLGEFLRFTWGPAKFFAQGHWINWELWPLDRERMQRAREARVGT